jgi:transcriptional regulator NrdR family protein
MKCPICATWTDVKDTRRKKDGSVTRVRVCANEHRFVTDERPRPIEKPLSHQQGAFGLTPPDQPR